MSDYPHIRHQQHGAFVRPGIRIHAAAIGCGDYLEWIKYEAEQAELEQRKDRRERFEPQDEPEAVAEPESVSEPEPDWKPSWLDRWNIAMRVSDVVTRDSGETWQEHVERQTEATNCTAFARSFERWIQAGCPTEKGKE